MQGQAGHDHVEGLVVEWQLAGVAITQLDPLGDRLAGPQKPRQAQLVGGRVTDQRDDLQLLGFGEGGLFAGTATAAPL